MVIQIKAEVRKPVIYYSNGRFGYGYDNEEGLTSIINAIRACQIEDEAFTSRFRFSMETFAGKLSKIISGIK